MFRSLFRKGPNSKVVKIQPKKVEGVPRQMSPHGESSAVRINNVTMNSTGPVVQSPQRIGSQQMRIRNPNMTPSNRIGSRIED